MHVDFQGNSRPSLLFQLFIVDLYNIVNIFSLDTNKQTDNCKVNIDLTIAETEFKEFESPLNFGRFKSRLKFLKFGHRTLIYFFDFQHFHFDKTIITFFQHLNLFS